ncbi:Uncharacterized protein AC499_1278 [Pseudomonas amygdali pv. lachrymans]|uniref:Uncharacterized protein n=1 Tax=Pseudomonas amygdali pv. lachrymans TaxID=53707 RepID=A0ABR5KU85_PSEAV|nr:Uncharacterized protein AC499_0319 [Pseudomonas amygdali pv. lachrymans]KPC18076.1 Uncharacterized protein AC499_1278 [Pseudomonas amygdali pv. lachrymans]
MAANNLQGWAEDEAYVLRLDRLADVLLMLSASTGLYVGQVKRYARRISKLSDAGGSKIKRAKALDFVVKALGYYSYDVAYRCRGADDFIQNFWPHGSAMSLRSLEKSVDQIHSNDRIIGILLHNYQRNLEQDLKLNREELILKDSSQKHTQKYLQIETLKRQIAEKTQYDSRRPLEYRADL